MKVGKRPSPPETLDPEGLSRRHTLAGPSRREVRFAGEASVYSVSEVRALGKLLMLDI